MFTDGEEWYILAPKIVHRWNTLSFSSPPPLNPYSHLEEIKREERRDDKPLFDLLFLLCDAVLRFCHRT